MTSLNASLPFSPMYPGGQPAASIGTNDPTSAYTPQGADESPGFLPLFLAHLNTGGIALDDTLPLDETTDLASASGQTPTSPVAGMLQANGFFQVAIPISDYLGATSLTGDEATGESSVDLGPGSLLKKWLAATQNATPSMLNTPANLPQPNLTDVPQQPTAHLAACEIAAPHLPANADLNPLVESQESGSAPAETPQGAASAFSLEDSLQPVEASATTAAPIRSTKYDDGSRTGSTAAMTTTAIPGQDGLIEAITTEIDSGDDSAVNNAGGRSPTHGFTDLDGDGTNATISASESRRLSNHPSSESITRHDDARPRPLADQVGDSFRDHLNELQQLGRVDVRMEIHPPELGHMQLQMTMQDNQLSVRMIVTNDSAKQVLEQQLEPLRIRFAEMGVSLGQLDVGRDSNAAHHQSPPDSERSPLPAQAGRNLLNRLRSPYLTATNPSELVDVIT